MAFKIKDHKKGIAIIALIIIVFFIVLSALQLLIERNPGVILVARSVAQKYGLPGGFIVAAVGSIWFIPFPYEIVVAPLLKFYSPPLLAIVVIAAGATLADIFNFYSGRKIGEKYLRKKVEAKTVDRIENFFEKYGIVALIILGFIAPVTSYDLAVFVIGGFSKMKYYTFLPVSFLCRVIHMTIVYFVADIFIKLAGATSYLVFV